MDPMTAAAGAAGNLVGGLISSGMNYHMQKKIYKWQKKAQEITWNREDNAVQRRAADLKAAGMNRLLAAGSGAATSSPIHLEAPDAPDFSHVGDPALEYVNRKLQVQKQQADVSQTEAQTELLMGQLDGVKKQNELLSRTLDWYKDHPGYAPNVSDSIWTGKGLEQIYGGPITRTAGRLGEWIGRKWAELETNNRKANRSYDKTYSGSYNFYRNTGLSHDEAHRRATNFARSQTSN